jgi:hypothetical protein
MPCLGLRMIQYYEEHGCYYRCLRPAILETQSGALGVISKHATPSGMFGAEDIGLFKKTCTSLHMILEPGSMANLQT